MGIAALVSLLPAWPLCAASVAEGPAASFRWGGASSPNMVSTARNLPADPGNTEPLWEIKTGTHQYSIPTIDRGRIFVAANDSGIERAGCKATGGGVVMCVEQATGKLIWRLPIPRYFAGVKPPYHFDQWDCGVCSGPVADGDKFIENYGDYRRNEGKTKGPRCRTCKYFKICEGPWREYPEIYGWKEFRPVLDKPGSR